MRLASLQAGWDTYNAEPPNETSRAYAERLLAVLELSSLIPARVLPSAEGGIALTFVASRKRAEIEVYNSGEMVAATYSDQDQLDVWEFAWTEAPATVAKIRVYLSA